MTRVLIDTGCDLREQLLDAHVDRIDAVFYTHEHADHTHGIDDLRVLALNNQKRVDVYFSRECGQRLREAFGYCFETAPGSGYPPILDAHEISSDDSIEIAGPGGTVVVEPFLQEHGGINSFGYRVGDFAYSCDLSGIPEQSHKAIRDLEVWILDALRPTPHPSHLSLPESLEIIERFAPQRAILTNLHIDMDYEAVARTTPDNVEPAHDGMHINFAIDAKRYAR
ncbi:MBL fold metallo-hydrolase [Devosia pacifica]|uniref:MBL fold metallo-hydrolase n=1 Tax=Devosia pacifica TaxID=1335967 RepID=UPI0027E4EEF8|nr:MBL fold metallo-hydrolase [Devosia pacifica]